MNAILPTLFTTAAMLSAALLAACFGRPSDHGLSIRQSRQAETIILAQESLQAPKPIVLNNGQYRSRVTARVASGVDTQSKDFEIVMGGLTRVNEPDHQAPSRGTLLPAEPYWELTDGYAMLRGRRPVGSTIRATFGSAGSTILLEIFTLPNGATEDRIYLIEGGPVEVIDKLNPPMPKITLKEPWTFARRDATDFEGPVEVQQYVDGTLTLTPERKRLNKILNAAEQGAVGVPVQHGAGH